MRSKVILKTPIHLIFIPCILSGIFGYAISQTFIDPNWSKLVGAIIFIVVFSRLYGKTVVSKETITKYYPLMPFIKQKCLKANEITKIDYKIISGGNGGVLSIFSNSKTMRAECNIEQKELVENILNIKINWHQFN